MKRLLLALLFIPSIAHAAPTYVLCAKGDKITAKPVCGRAEERIFLSDLLPQSASASRGENCHIRESSASGSNIVGVASVCLVSEMIIASGCFIEAAPGVVISQKLLNTEGTNSLVPHQVYGGVSCVANDPTGSGRIYKLTAQAQCCGAIE